MMTTLLGMTLRMGITLEVMMSMGKCFEIPTLAEMKSICYKFYDFADMTDKGGLTTCVI